MADLSWYAEGYVAKSLLASFEAMEENWHACKTYFSYICLLVGLLFHCRKNIISKNLIVAYTVTQKLIHINRFDLN